MRKLNVGDNVRVVDEAGLEGGSEGVIISPRGSLNRDGRGIPQIGGGHYKPFDAKKECVVEQENGRIFTMFWCCVRGR